MYGTFQASEPSERREAPLKPLPDAAALEAFLLVGQNQVIIKEN